jgi:hypothetical protein
MMAVNYFISQQVHVVLLPSSMNMLNTCAAALT